MSTVFLVAQGALMGMVAHQLYPDGQWQFWALITANSGLVVGYGLTKTR